MSRAPPARQKRDAKARSQVSIDNGRRGFNHSFVLSQNIRQRAVNRGDYGDVTGTLTFVVDESGASIWSRLSIGHFGEQPGVRCRTIGLLECRRLARVLLVAVSEFDIKYIAHLARLSLSPEEETKLGGQLSSIIGHIEKLKEVDVTRVEPTAHALPMANITRPDEVRSGLTHEEALANAPASASGLFIVPKIVE